MPDRSKPVVYYFDVFSYIFLVSAVILPFFNGISLTVLAYGISHFRHFPGISVYDLRKLSVWHNTKGIGGIRIDSQRA
ncbi:hypothetical protein EDC63_101584 [Sulfurirhabdus autotrophica]|uniref:Uncharacterized protein n=1 Tax=Sulfurirhabdus autotrophica TaxID=1706046 RepID=A0A4R3YEU8_9PROT|nr:hypothetical protein EDC63_101584 [Sulfurirhabdus autotrophica]